MFGLKNKPLAIQIWIILGLILGISATLLIVLMQLVLRISFTNETYARIADTQEYILTHEYIMKYTTDLGREPKIRSDKKIKFIPPSFRVVRHIFLTDNEVITNNEISEEFLKQLRQDGQEQQTEIKHYSTEIEQRNILYVMRRAEVNGKKGYLVSYLSGMYRDNLVKTTFNLLRRVLVLILLISWIASIFIARYLTRPLVELQEKVKKIAVRKWDKPVSLQRGDEIGKLGDTIEWMRCQLLEQEQKKQSFLQQISHELKSPIMVIRSYAQAIIDGIFPRGNLEASVKVIEDETKGLEQRVHSLLKLTKFDYISTLKLNKSDFNLTALVSETVNTVRWRASEINWEIQLDEIMLKGDRDKLKVALDNILDNQIRYSKQRVSINLSKIVKDRPGILLRIWNDGPEIKDEIMSNLFKKFTKGDHGDFGLGLAIVKLIIDLHHGEVWASNEEQGVAFYLWFNL